MLPILTWLLLSPPQTHVPAIARILGVRVGWNGTKGLERIVGPGLVSIGGHPNSARIWMVKSPEGGIRTDGFSIGVEGVVLEWVSWDLDSRPAGHAKNADDRRFRKAPYAKLPKNPGWLGSVVPGMTPAQVSRLTRRIGSPKIEKINPGETWTWTAKGHVVPTLPQLNDSFDVWTARLYFNKGRLQSIDVSCE